MAGLAGDGPALSYVYHGDLDLLGHVYGSGSEPWRLQLSHVDRLAQAIADRLPPGAALVVTADHGMVRTPPASGPAAPTPVTPARTRPPRDRPTATAPDQQATHAAVPVAPHSPAAA